MKATKSSSVSGKWFDKKVLKTGDLAKLKSEATEEPSQMGGTQWVAKLAVKGHPEAANIAINKPSKNALIEAFGEETKDWIDKLLTVHVETAIVSGKRGVALYLVPEGFEVKEDSGGYLVVVRKGVEPVEYPTDDIDPDLVPF